MRHIPGYPRYSLTTDGQLYFDGELADVFIGLDGYRQAWIYRGKKRLRHPRKIYQLMARTYLSPKPGEGYVIRHLDGNCHNDSMNNLCWGTHKENMQDLKKHNASRSPVTNELKSEIQNRILNSRPYASANQRVEVLRNLASTFNVSYLTINSIDRALKGSNHGSV